jgi:hypothetical protein
MMKSNHLFIGIDDTDCLNTKGTEHFTRCLGRQIEQNGLGQIAGISKHQLLKHDSIEYTTANQSVCIELKNADSVENLVAFMRSYVRENASRKSQAGFCISEAKGIPRKVVDFGLSCKSKIASTETAYSVAAAANIHIEGIKENSAGIIGALAAVGLRATGEDGYVIWVKGHEIINMAGIFHAGEIYCHTRVDSIRTADGFRIPVNATIEWQNEAHPVILENYITLLVEEHPEKEKCDWRVVEPA